MAAIHIHTAAEHMGFPIRYVFIRWQIGVEYLFFGHYALPSYY